MWQYIKQQQTLEVAPSREVDGRLAWTSLLEMAARSLWVGTIVSVGLATSWLRMVVAASSQW